MIRYFFLFLVLDISFWIMYMKLFNILERNIISGYITEVTLKYISVSDNSSIFEEYSH